MPIDPDSTQTSRSRLLVAGKTLFARHGYEQTSTAAIAREAGTSESPLVRYFDGKTGSLETIFNKSWRPLNDEVQKRIANAPHAREVVLDLLSAVTDRHHRTSVIGDVVDPEVRSFPNRSRSFLKDESHQNVPNSGSNRARIVSRRKFVGIETLRLNNLAGSW